MQVSQEDLIQGFIDNCSRDGFVIEELITSWYSRFRAIDSVGDCIDGGAYQGFHTLRMSRKFSGRVFALEASPQNYAELLKKLKRYPTDMPGIPVPVNVAIVGKPGTPDAEFYESDSHPGRSTTKPGIWHALQPGKVSYSEAISVDCRTIDELVDEHTIRQLALIKLDLEGAELDALLGGEKTIDDLRPPIVMEFGLRNYNETVFEQRLQDFFDLLKRTRYFGYAPWGERIESPGQLRFWYVFLFPGETDRYLRFLQDSWLAAHGNG
jgi:FkbM family methyltransferase